MGVHPLPNGWGFKPSRKDTLCMQVSKIVAGYYGAMGELKAEMTRLEELAELEDELAEQAGLDAIQSKYGDW